MACRYMSLPHLLDAKVKVLALAKTLLLFRVSKFYVVDRLSLIISCHCLC